MEPMLIGAALGGGISAARGGNPITGALLGGITGGIGSSVMGAAGAAASKAATTGLTAGGGSVGLTAPAMTGIGLTPAGAGLTAGQAALQAPASFSGVGLTSSAAPTFMQTIKEVPGVLGDYIKQNPMETLKLGNSLLGGDEQQMMPQSAGLMRGQQMQQQAPAYAMARPQISLI